MAHTQTLTKKEKLTQEQHSAFWNSPMNKTQSSMKPSAMRLLSGILLMFLLAGCAASTKVVKNEKATIKDYGELYFILPSTDPRNVVPKIVAEFQSMGFNVKTFAPEKPLEGAQGTGFFVSQAGHVLTCAHVIGEEKTATVWHNNVRYEADVIAADEKRDLALLKLRAPEPRSFPTASFRNDRAPAMGEDVFTIGYPMSKLLGNSARLSKGLISATTGLNDAPEQIQISAEIQPGNSGGPLFDQSGAVLGVVQQTLNPWRMARQTGGALPQNINFALKSAEAIEFLQSAGEGVGREYLTDTRSSIEAMQRTVVKVKSGILPMELENKPKMVAVLNYQSMWDMWFRFRFFVLSFYDFDTQDVLFHAGQGHDNMVSNEEVVIKDTLNQVRKTLAQAKTVQPNQ